MGIVSNGPMSSGSDLTGRSLYSSGYEHVNISKFHDEIPTKELIHILILFVDTERKKKKQEI